MSGHSQRTNEAWRRWNDPRATERDYEKWREQHRAEIHKRVVNTFQSYVGHIADSTPVALVAAVSGLSESTVRTYVRKKKFGKRGPLMATAFALRLMNRTVQ